MNDTILKLKNINKVFVQEDKKETSAIDDVSLEIKSGEFVSILGPSGCGKTTLLKIIAGLLSPTNGQVEISNNDTHNSLMFVFQEYNRSLFPWKTVYKNISFGLELDNMGDDKIEKEVKKYLKLVNLEGFENHYPWELSGGMQQRVAIARAIICNPKLLLMDEPFGSLDALSRSSLEDDLLQLWKEQKFTVLFVTHDIDEAIYLSQKVILLSSRPSKIIDTIEIELDYPRHQIESKNSNLFAGYRKNISEKIGRTKLAYKNEQKV